MQAPTPQPIGIVDIEQDSEGNDLCPNCKAPEPSQWAEDGERAEADFISCDRCGLDGEIIRDLLIEWDGGWITHEGTIASAIERMREDHAGAYADGFSITDQDVRVQAEAHAMFGEGCEDPDAGLLHRQPGSTLTITQATVAGIEQAMEQGVATDRGATALILDDEVRELAEDQGGPESGPCLVGWCEIRLAWDNGCVEDFELPEGAKIIEVDGKAKLQAWTDGPSFELHRSAV
jgi:hypothetical protein